MLAFLPRLAKRLIGRDLEMPNIATWWCGQTDACADVLENLERVSIAGAFGDSAAGLSTAGRIAFGDRS